MCGLTGYWLFDGQIETNSATILEMLRIQKHRGPDDSGIVAINSNIKSFESIAIDQPSAITIKPSLIFGFNRLSILDLSPNGHQPMLSDDHSVILMMNGEVYNAFDYKEELIAKGIIFRSETDTEIVLNLYLMHGLQGMLDRLNGMYAIAIYDFRKNKLFLIRDRLGIKPMYVLQDKGRLAFSSEMKSFKALPGFKFQLDDSGLSEFLLFRNLINKTLFKNIVNIEPGHYLEINNDGEISRKQYYDIRSEGHMKLPVFDEKLVTEILKSSLQQAVKRQMISDVKLGCQLSGGVDSSLVTAYANQFVTKGSLETISIVFDNQRYSEKKYIDQVAEKLHLQSHQFTLTAKDYMDNLEEAIWHFEQPLNHPNTIGIKLLSREARKHVTVLLSGEGADEALAGYGRFLPPSNNLWSRTFLGGLKKNRSKLSLFLAYWMSKDQRYLMQTAFGSISTAASLYPSFSYKKAVAQRHRLWDSLKKSPVQQKRKYELLTYLPDLLMRQDKMSMAHSIENRVPFLDHDMVSTSLSLQDEVLIGKRNGHYEGKMLLKKLCAGEFGEDFSFRNKMGFSIPLSEFFASSSFKEKWQSKIFPGIQKRALFNSKKIELWAKKPQNLYPDQLDALWLMTGFELWAQQYLD